MYEYYLFDLDHTLFDFERAEDVSLKEVFNRHQVELSPELLAAYNELNLALWKDYEAQRITREVLLVSRFERLFSTYQLHLDAEQFNEIYLGLLASQPMPMEGAVEVLETLSKKATIVIATNGPSLTQRDKLKSSGLYQYVDHLITSEDAGVAKPDPDFFYYLRETIGIPDLSRALMIGDNPHTDIFGARRAGFDTCLFDPQDKNLGEDATYRIKKLVEVLNL